MTDRPETLSQDPIINVVHRGIKADINTLLANGGGRGAVILIYAGMDTMASLDIPDDQTEVRGRDFIRWAERYVRFPGPFQVSGEEFYAARCGMLHTYTADARATRAGRARRIGYADKMDPPVYAAPAAAPDIVLVAVPGLRDAFFRGIDAFLVEAFAAGAEKRATVERRWGDLIHDLPADPKDIVGSGDRCRPCCSDARGRRADGTRMPANGFSHDTLTTGEAAKLLRVCRQTVIKWADDGDIPSWRTSGGHRRFSAAELRASGYVAGREAAPRSHRGGVGADARAGHDRRGRQLLRERGRPAGAHDPPGPGQARPADPARLTTGRLVAD